jgi:uncharacterized protein YdeI (YjbR/CyaY-like superfamily)
MKKTEQAITGIAVFYPKTMAEWHKWLAKHHDSAKGVWLVGHNKISGRKSLTWSESVDVALCYGWIDSKKIKVDEHTTHQFFCKRKPKSTWSRINKQKVERLIAEGLMTPAGLAVIEVAKQNGSWYVLDAIEDLIVPDDLTRALKASSSAYEFFNGCSKSTKKMILYWVTSAKRPETRLKRIEEITSCAAQGKKPTSIA